jgi:hypothetical protein
VYRVLENYNYQILVGDLRPWRRVVEDTSLLGCYAVLTDNVVTEVSKDRSAFICRVCSSNEVLTLPMAVYSYIGLLFLTLTRTEYWTGSQTRYR